MTKVTISNPTEALMDRIVAQAKQFKSISDAYKTTVRPGVVIQHMPITIGTREYEKMYTKIDVRNGKVMNVHSYQDSRIPFRGLHPHIDTTNRIMCSSGGDAQAITAFNNKGIIHGLMEIIKTVSSFYPEAAYRIPIGTVKCEICGEYNDHRMITSPQRCNDCDKRMVHDSCQSICAYCMSGVCSDCSTEVPTTNGTKIKVCAKHTDIKIVANCRLCEKNGNGYRQPSSICANCGAGICAGHAYYYEHPYHRMRGRLYICSECNRKTYGVAPYGIVCPACLARHHKKKVPKMPYEEVSMRLGRSIERTTKYLIEHGGKNDES